MNKLPTTVTDKIYLYGLMLAAFIMPLHKNIIVWTLILLGVFWAFSGNWNIKIKNVYKNIFNIFVFVFLYLVYIFGLIYTTNLNAGFFDIQVKFCLFAIPIVFFSIPEKIITRPILFAFIAGCLVSCILCIGAATYNYFITKNITCFYYINLSLIHHPSYLAMYVDFAIACLIYFEFNREKKNLSYTKMISFILVFIFSIFVGLLSSKIGIMILVLIFLFAITYFIKVYRKIWIGIGLSVLCILFFSCLLYFNSNIYQRFDSAKKSYFEKSANHDGTYDRLQVWKVGVSIINHHTLIGVGTGDIKDVLVEEYRKGNIMNAYEKKLNAHNQFLQTFISIGITGFIVLLVLLIIPLIMAIKQKHLLYVIFIIIIIINFLVESMFETQAGVVFFAFFNTLLFLDLKNLSIKKVPCNETF